MYKLGIDVSKKKLDCAFIVNGKTLSKAVQNDKVGYQKLLEWCLKKANCPVDQIYIIVEATSIYHEAVVFFFYELDASVSVVNPSRIKKFAESEGARNKDDKFDAKTIARFGLKMNLRKWRPKLVEYHHFQEMLKRIENLSNEIQREENRLEKLENSVNPSEVLWDSIQRHLEFLKAEKERIQQTISEHISLHPKLKRDDELLQSIPGIGPVVASWMNVLLQNGEAFESAKEAAAYTGVTPKNHISGNRVVKKASMSKMGPAIYRQKLYMAAIVAIRYNPDVKELYQRLLANGKNKMQALGAAMRKIVHICFGVIHHQVQYQVQFTVKNA